MRKGIGRLGIKAVAVCLAVMGAAGRIESARGDACCLPAGTCSVVASQAACLGLGGCWQGGGSVCTSRYCPAVSSSPAGACILSTGNCAEMTEADCLCLNGANLDHANLNFWAGPNTTCATLEKINYWMPGPLGGTPGGQINISGATLFVPFFQVSNSYNDYNNPNGNLIPCSSQGWGDFKDTNCDGNVDFVGGDRPDLLGRSFFCPGGANPIAWWGYWLVQYRSVGSVNGYQEFIDYQLLGKLPNTIPTEEGLINGCRWALGGAKTGPCSGCDAICLAPVGAGDMNCNDVLDGADIQGFINKLVSGTSPCIPPATADFNRDGLEDFNDVDEFIRAVLIGGQGVYGDPAQNPGGLPGQTGTPVCPNSIDLAFLDVPGKWGTVGPSGAPNFRRKPNEPGYGRNNVPSSTGFISNLARIEKNLKGPNSAVVSLNFNQSSPDNNTLYDTSVAFVPVVPISSQGTGVQNMKFTDLQWLLVTGRMPSGENLVGTTRDVGSGTRNAYNNALGIDPSWGMGDNDGGELINENPDSRGPGSHLGYVLNGTFNQLHYTNNCGGSGILERGTQNRRLAIGYTGLFGNGRAIADAISGNYEILNVCKDIDGDGDGNIDSDCSPFVCDNVSGPVTGCPTPPGNWQVLNNGYVRPSIDSVLDNNDPRCSYTVGASGSFVSRGDPEYGRPGHTNSYPMANARARDYLLNIIDSIHGFISNPLLPPPALSPAQYLARNFTLLVGLDSVQDLNNPTKFVPQSVDQVLQDVIRCSTTQITPPFGHNGNPNLFNKIPQRVNQTSAFVTLPEPYSDGSLTGNYRNATGAFSVAGGGNLSLSRCKLMGDFNADGVRDWNDIDKMMVAIKNPAAFQLDDVAGGVGGLAPAGGSATNYIIPELIGDFDGDGNFGDRVAASYIEILGPSGTSMVGTIEPGVEMSDARYFADGLALDPVTRKLNRKEGFIRVDNAWNAVTPGDINFFNTTLVTGTYAAGDSRADVAGNSPTPGSNPRGSDGVVNVVDIDYICKNYIQRWGGDDSVSSFNNLNSAINTTTQRRIDLSCDMNGDLTVDFQDVIEVVVNILDTQITDLNLDGVTNAADLTIACSNTALPSACWSSGDVNGDGVVNGTDLNLIAVAAGLPPSCP